MTFIAETGRALSIRDMSWLNLYFLFFSAIIMQDEGNIEVPIQSDTSIIFRKE
jgi:hypothetical protein